jgi:predicted ATPase/DNA-binding SARP family transcriptional activator
MEVVGSDGTEVPVRGEKLRALLALLSLSCRRVVASERLIDELWGDDQPADVANGLQRLVSKLRKAIGSDLVVTRPPGYSVQLDPGNVDVLRFDDLIASARAAAAAGDLESAVALFAEAETLWRGPPLADFEYAEFAQPLITRLQELRLAIVEDRVDAELALARHAPLIGDLEALVGANPLRERMRGQLMVALYRVGRQADALRAFHEGRTMLAEELGLEPGPDLRRLEAAILSQDPSLDAPDTAPPLQQQRRSRPKTNVKAALTPLVGRRQELDEVVMLLDGRRLVTLVGPGGTGKTRLAEETARLLVGTLPDGAFMIELAPVGDPAVLADCIATTLELRDTGGDALARVCQFCSGKHMLFVLDNCEHVVDAAARAVDALLGAGEGVRILATSREALRVTGETVWPVPPLPADDAFDLFTQRALAADPHFVLDADGAALIRDICRRLDGLPLAIELAAARLRAFPLAQIADRIGDRFRLLTGGSRTALPRQQTLRAVVDWSYDLLFEDERRVFERLSVFPAGCTLASAVETSSGDGIDRLDVEDIVASLVDKSLLFVDGGRPAARYRMLQTLNQYARERLVDRGEADLTFARMADHLAGLCAHTRQAFRGVGQQQWFDDIAAELDNLRAAFEWAVAATEPDLANRLAADLAFHRWVSGEAVDGHRWLVTALAMPGSVSPLTRGRALFWRAYLGYMAVQEQDVDVTFDEAIRLLRDHADAGEVGVALAFYAQIMAESGRIAKAAALNEQSLEYVNQASDEPWLRAASTWLRATIAAQRDGDFATFEVLVREAVGQFRAAGDSFLEAIALNVVAELDERRGNYDEAMAALRTARAMAARMHVAGFEASLTARLGLIALSSGDGDQATHHLEQALQWAHELGYPPVQAQALNGLANVRRRQGQYDEARAAASEALDLYRGASGRSAGGAFTAANARYEVPAGAAASLSALGFVAELTGDATAAAGHHAASLEQARLIGDPRAVAVALEGLAGAAALRGDATTSARLLGHAARVRTSQRAVVSPSEQSDVDRARYAAMALLDRHDFDAAFEQGASAELDELVSVPADG